MSRQSDGRGRVVHCRRATYDVYVGRGADPRSGETPGWGNPFYIGRDGDREAVLVRYRRWLLSRPALVARARLELRGRVLGCWCAPEPCHGDILVEVANGPEAEEG